MDSTYCPDMRHQKSEQTTGRSDTTIEEGAERPPNAPDEILTFWFSDPRRPGVLRCPEWLFSNMASNA